VEPVLYETRARILAEVSDEDLEVCLRVFDTLRAAVESAEAGTLAGAASS
jgi:hypothetical protein